MSVPFILFFVTAVTVLLVIGRFRLSHAKPQRIQRAVIYQMVRLDASVRTLFETTLGNKPVMIQNSSGPILVYLGADDWRALHPESPPRMAQQGYSIRADIELPVLLAGGWGKGLLLAWEKQNVTANVVK